jgi:hypothetical protein
MEYGNKDINCERCDGTAHRKVGGHTIKGMPLTKQVYTALDAFLGVLKKQDPSKVRMAGAAYAEFKSGTKLKLVAISGPRTAQPLAIQGWELVDPELPAAGVANGWRDVYGRIFNFPAMNNVGNACAAVKLLSAIGLKNPKAGEFNTIELCEGIYKPTGAKVDATFRAFRSDFVTNRDFAHAVDSCEACTERLPRMLRTSPDPGH